MLPEMNSCSHLASSFVNDLSGRLLDTQRENEGHAMQNAINGRQQLGVPHSSFRATRSRTTNGSLRAHSERITDLKYPRGAAMPGPTELPANVNSTQLN